MFGAAHRLAAAGYDDQFIENWITTNMTRDPQPQEIANTLRKVRAEASGEIPPSPGVCLKRDPDPERLAELTKEGPLSEAKFAATSPDSTEGVTTSDFLRTLFGSRKTILFNDDETQGQIVWSAGIPDHAVDYLIASNKAGIKYLVNPVDGVMRENIRLGKESRRAEENLVSYDYALVESDSVEPELWLRVLHNLGLPLVAVTLSGNKSAHALVRVAAASREEYDAFVMTLADNVIPLGADHASLSAVRLSRLPGVTRRDTGKEQKLIYLDRKLAVTGGKAPLNDTAVTPTTSPCGLSEETSPAEDTEVEAIDTSDATCPEKPNPSTSLANRFEDLYYDGNNMFMRSGDGIWRRENANMVGAALRVRGFSGKTPKELPMSPLDRAYAYIRQNRRVDGAGPCLYHPQELWSMGTLRYLNTAAAAVWPADQHAGEWGEHFPRYASVLDNVFKLQGHQTVFLAWFKRFYESACAGNLEAGQALVLVGPVECFKSFLIERLLQPAMGGYADLSSIASGEGNGFNSELFHSPLAVIDDTKASASQAQQQKYSSVIKKLTAHGTHKYHEKYLTPISVHWRGRVVIAANDDPVSIKAVPALDMSNEDKIIALSMQSWRDNPGPDTWKGLEAAELGAFLAWLKAWEVPSQYLDKDSRYLVRSVVSEFIRQQIDAASPTAELQATIAYWWSLRPPEDQKTPWEGNTVELHQEFHLTMANTTLSREWPVRVMGQRLSQLSAQGPESGVELLQKRAGAAKINIWRIYPPGQPVAPAPPAPAAPESHNPF
jgi:hypothetical protein